MPGTHFTHAYKAHTITVWIRLEAVAPFPSHMQQVYDALTIYFSHNHTKTMTLSAELIQSHGSQTCTPLLCHPSMAVSWHCNCPPSHLTPPIVTQCGFFLPSTYAFLPTFKTRYRYLKTKCLLIYKVLHLWCNFVDQKFASPLFPK